MAIRSGAPGSGLPLTSCAAWIKRRIGRVAIGHEIRPQCAVTMTRNGACRCMATPPCSSFWYWRAPRRVCPGGPCSTAALRTGRPSIATTSLELPRCRTRNWGPRRSKESFAIAKRWSRYGPTPAPRWQSRPNTVSLDAFLWAAVSHRPIVNHWTNSAEVPARTELSDAMSRRLRKYGFSFVGSTICYAFMQATGMVDDHLISCFRRASRG